MLLFHRANPAVIMPIGRAGEVDIRHQVHTALLQRFGQCYECLGLNSHYGYLVRFTAFIILDRAANRLIQIFLAGYR